MIYVDNGPYVESFTTKIELLRVDRLLVIPDLLDALTEAVV